LYSVPPDVLANLAYTFEYRYSDGRDPKTYTKNLVEAVERWREVAPQAAGALAYRRGPGFLLVHDRRPGFEPADYRFDGIEAKIYLACDAGNTAAQIHRQLAAAGDDTLDTSEVERYLEELVDVRLMYREGKSFLSLAVAVRNAEAVVPVDTPETNNSTLPVLISR
jgi:hypothetical protein